MKISKLYLRMLIAFILVQAIAILLMFGLMHTGAIRPPFARHAEDRAVAFRNLINRELAGVDKITPGEERRLNSLLHAFADAFRGYAWITDPQGTIVAKSFRGGPPLTGEEELEKQFPTPFGDTFFLLEKNDHINAYMVGTVNFHGQSLTVHMLHQWKKKRAELWFMEGLLVTSIIAALLLIPASRRITRPLQELTDAAEMVAHGDFSPRVNLKGRGELSVLANTFNSMAKSLEKMVRGGRELTANLSHELRSPLARIRISQQIMQERIEVGRTDGVEKHLNKMETEIDHMDGLIDKILKLSKLDLQEAPPREDMVDMAKLLSDTVTRQHPLMKEKAISITQELKPAPEFPCHKEDIQMVLDNVLGNAIKYSENNSVITAKVDATIKDVFLRVTNPYPPLSDSELETVFIPFRRLGYDKVEGNGLGLAFAQRIVTEHGGIMEASNTPEGFCMTIRLPLA